MVIGSSETGEADRVDGPYYAFKLIQTLRSQFPQWAPFVGPEGGPLNIVPVDFVARAMDHIAHLDGLDNRAFHLVDPAPLSLGDTLNTFCRAAHAPEFALRFDRRMTKMIPGDTLKVVGDLPAIKRVRQQVLDRLGDPYRRRGSQRQQVHRQRQDVPPGQQGLFDRGGICRQLSGRDAARHRGADRGVANPGAPAAGALRHSAGAGLCA